MYIIVCIVLLYIIDIVVICCCRVRKKCLKMSADSDSASQDASRSLTDSCDEAMLAAAVS